MWSWFWVVPSAVELAAVVAAAAVAFVVEAAAFAVEGSGVKVNAGSSEEMNCLKKISVSA